MSEDQLWKLEQYETLAEWLGEQDFSRNRRDYTDEYVTHVNVDVETLAERLMQSDWLSAHDAEVRADQREKDAQMVEDPRVGYLVLGLGETAGSNPPIATRSTIADAIRAGGVDTSGISEEEK